MLSASIGGAVKRFYKLIQELIVKAREEPTLLVFGCKREKIFEYNVCRCIKDWKMKRC